MDLPTGTVTFLLTDIEGSTRLWELQPEHMQQAQARHEAIVASCVSRRGGNLIKSRGEGDSTFSVFRDPSDALAACLDLQLALAAEPSPVETPIRVRAALHTGTATPRDGDYYSTDVNRCARLRAIAHGGQCVISQATYLLVGNRMPLGAEARDMGLHRLKDLSTPEHVWQLCHSDLESEFPPLASLDPIRTNLPLQATTFVGRELELRETVSLLARTRLLTLTGSGGSGKTRLALHAAADVVDHYPHGVWLAELAAVSEPGLVESTVAKAVGAREQPGRTVLESVVDHLGDKSLLLVLDNCEHVVDACAHLAEAVLRVCPRVCMLATSREPLRLSAETTYRVPSLALPDRASLPAADKGLMQILAGYDAVRLFVERTRSHRPDFALTRENALTVAEVCRKLDGIPLAVELAAARMRAMTVQQISSRLNDRFRLLTGGSRSAMPRQQTLRAALDWSYNLLNEPERRMLQRFSVFAGGCSLEAAEAVCGEPGVETRESTGPCVLDLLISLVDKSLVVFEEIGGDGRYRLLETVRQYAMERLAESGEHQDASSRHARYYSEFMIDAKPYLRGPEQATWLASIDAEHGNLRAALDNLVGAKSPRALAVAEAALWYWMVRGHLREADTSFRLVLERCAPPEPTEDLAATLSAAAGIAMSCGDFDRARALLRKALDAARSVGAQRLVRVSLSNLGVIALQVQQYQEAGDYFRESAAVARAIGDRTGIATNLGNLALVESKLGGERTALAHLTEALALHRENGDDAAVANVLSNLGPTARRLGDYPAAARYLDECLSLCRRIGNERETEYALDAVARLCYDAGRLVATAVLLGAANGLRERSGSRRPDHEDADWARVVSDLQEQLGAATCEALVADGGALTMEEAVDMAVLELRGIGNSGERDYSESGT